MERFESTALTGTEGTRVGQALRPDLAAHPGKSGIYSPGEARDAFAVRKPRATTPHVVASGFAYACSRSALTPATDGSHYAASKLGSPRDS